MNKDLLKLYQQFDNLYRNIHLICANCLDHDCEGYVWLLKDEANLLFANTVPIIEINNDINFIHSFEKDNGNIIVDKPKPPCRLREKGLCSVYNIRPLVCRMYPVGFVTVNNDVMLVIHKDCKFSRELQGVYKETFVREVFRILNNVTQEILDEITETYRRVDGISTFPEGSNSYEILMPNWKNNNERR